MKVHEIVAIYGVSRATVYRKMAQRYGERTHWIYDISEADARSMFGGGRPLKDRVEALEAAQEALHQRIVTQEQLHELEQRIGEQFRLFSQALGLEKPLTRNALASWLHKHHVPIPTATEWIGRWIRDGQLVADEQNKIASAYKGTALRLAQAQQAKNPPQNSEYVLAHCVDPHEPFCVCHELLPEKEIP